MSTREQEALPELLEEWLEENRCGGAVGRCEAGQNGVVGEAPKARKGALWQQNGSGMLQNEKEKQKDPSESY